jgi:hypothetical protein
MKVQIGNQFFDAEETPILLILNENDKRNLANMKSDAYIYLCFPKNISEVQAQVLVHQAKEIAKERGT